MSNFLRDETDFQLDKQRVWAGFIASSAVDFLDRVDIVIPNLDETTVWQDVRWQARDNITLPQAGDECTVILDDNNELWVVAWWRVPTVVNGKFIKGVGGAAVWIQPTNLDVGLPNITTSTFSGGPPASPVEGDIWIATNISDDAASNKRWSFSYRAADAATRPWKFIGGAPIQRNGVGSTNTADSAYHDTGHSWTVTRGGIYVVKGNLSGAIGSGGAGSLQISYNVNGSDVGNMGLGSFAASAFFTIEGASIAVTPNAASVVKLRYWANNAFTNNYGSLSITPTEIA
jgi:hypothetical protein